jgi:hypothetical protein
LLTRRSIPGCAGLLLQRARNFCLLWIHQPALARGAADTRTLAFGGGELTIDVEIVLDGDQRTLLGQLAPPPESATVELQDANGDRVIAAASDTLGRFRLAFSGSGRFRLVVVRPGSAPIETSWFTV